MTRAVSRTAIAAMLSGVFFAGASQGSAQAQAAADGEGRMELVEARAALEMAKRKLAALEENVKALESANLALGESLAAAEAEAGQYRKSYGDIRLQMEALGVEAIKPGFEGIEQRLLKAVSDIRLLEEEKEKLAAQLMRLSEATMNYMHTAVSPETEDRAALEAELKAAGEALALRREGAPAVARPIDQAKVITLKPEYGLIVLDAGEASGVRVGMPLQLMRDGRVVATALVINVRSNVSGAVLQKVAEEGDKVRVGDRVDLQVQGTL